MEAYLGKKTGRGLIASVVFKHFRIILFLQINHSVFFSDAHNFSSSQLQQSDNRTIQRFVEAYVDSYIGG